MHTRRFRSPKLSHVLALLLVAAGAGLGLAFRPDAVRATPPEVALPLAPPAGVDGGAAAGDEEDAPDVTSPNVQIVVSTVPQAQATVTWGKQRLGKIEPGKPLVVTRPRDSGPLDVTVRATGFLVVQTRAHTFSSNKLQVRLTRPDQTTTLVGYRIPLDAGIEAPEAGTLADFAP